ncbi:MAG: site-specific DNA-methyltransferase, partial [Gammaproteobacteria bacterium]|nr:site-specific DNA-methyltransferase [Gammaproteobacteria bacterium]
MEKFDRLKEILRTMFQLDRGDLDFGLYRIMNLKAREIEDFLDKDLLPQVQDALTGNAAKTLADLEEELVKARITAGDLGIDLETTPKFRELQQLIKEARADVAAEADVYNHLANFFDRYYADGDFMSLRRYSGGGQPTYLLPYDGEEVKLHWANADQYYIKTTENYAAYVFTVGAGAEQRRVRFETARADNEKDNIKEANDRQRRFLLAQGAGINAVAISNDELVVRFTHRPLTENEKKTLSGNGSKQQETINQAISERILNSLEPAWQVLLAVAAPTENNPQRTVLDKHLATYTAKNSFDYFIHKDLGGFLRRELDLYLKTDVLNLDDLEAGDTLRLQRALARTRAVRQVAAKIIAFLAQLENFQKQLWLKKKFVLDTQYCVTLDKVPQALYPEIVQNVAQHDEWVELFAIDEIEGNLGNGNAGYTKPLTVDFLKHNPYLVLDTRHFDSGF